MITLGVVVTVAGGASAVYFGRRELMKKRDVEIEIERLRERKIEREEEIHRVAAKHLSIQHFTHPHPLYEVNFGEKQSTLNCNICSEPISRWGYSCGVGDCNFNIHKVCANNPVSLSPCTYYQEKEMCSENIFVGAARAISSFAHDKPQGHLLVEKYSNREYGCTHCLTSGQGKRYRCDECVADVHPVCAKHPTRISSFMHPQHELELKTKKHFKDCDICHKDMGPNLRVYRCKECMFYVHPVCSQLPQYLLHELHPMNNPPHPLKLIKTKVSARCDVDCGSNCKGWCYHCPVCNVYFHIACLLRKSVHGQSKRSDVHDIIQVLEATEKIINIVNIVVSS